MLIRPFDLFGKSFEVGTGQDKRLTVNIITQRQFFQRSAPRRKNSAEIITQNRIGSVHTVISYFRDQPFIELAGTGWNFCNCRVS